MARLRFRKRIKNPFRKQHSGGVGDSGGGGNDDKSVGSSYSNSSAASSLASDIRTHGPIDIDTCKKHNRRSSKRRGSRSRGKERSKKDILSAREREALPKIIESRSSTPSDLQNGNNGNSRSPTPSASSQQNNAGGSGQASTPSRTSLQELASPATEPAVEPAVEETPDDSPGAQTASTVNGLDVFERSRSALSVLSSVSAQIQKTAAASLASHLAPPTETASDAPADDSSSRAPRRAASSSANSLSTPPPDYFVPSWLEVTSRVPSITKRNEIASRVPSIQKRDRSATPNSAANSTSTDKLLEEAEMELLSSTASYSSSKGRTSDNERTPPVGAKTGRRTERSREHAKPSPTSVAGEFQSAYPVELNPSVSISDQSDKYSIDEKPIIEGRQRLLPEEPDRYDIKAGDHSTPSLRTPRASNASQHRNKSAAEASSQTRIVAPPKINRLSPTKMFNDARTSFKTTGWDPLRYTSLEDAVVAHAAMLAAPGADANEERGRQRGADAEGVVLRKTGSYGGSVSSNTLGTRETDRGSSSHAHAQFLALKKDAEKNEFKKVITQLKKQAAKMEPQENIELQARDLDSILVDEETPPRGKRADGEQAPPVDPPGVDPLPHGQRDPPGVDGSGTRSESLTPPTPPTPESPNPFVEDIASSPSLQQEEPIQAQCQIASDTTTSNVVVDVIQSFSFEGEFGVQYSLSDDSCSYLSELESIGDITICEETTRLLEAHKLYDAEARSNVNHPARRKRSIMRVGSQFKNGSGSNNRDDGKGKNNVGSPRSSARFDDIPSDKMMITEQRKKLSWYDDEENWNKPFTLRTDESFDASTVSSIGGRGGVGMVEGGVKRVSAQYNTVVDQFLGDFIKGIGKYAACAGNEDDVASFDVVDQQEI